MSNKQMIDFNKVKSCFAVVAEFWQLLRYCFLIIERLWVHVSVRQGLSVGGVNVQRSLHLQYYDEVPLIKEPNPNCSLGTAG